MAMFEKTLQLYKNIPKKKDRIFIVT